METNQGAQRWEDIVFENRNKSYGAYAIRKNYHEHVLRSMMICLVIFATAFLLPKKPKIESSNPPIGDSTIVQLYPDPRIEPPVKKQPPVKSRTDVVPTSVTTAIVPEDTTKTVPTQLSTTPTDGTGTDIVVDPGPDTGTGIAVETPVETPPWRRGAEIMPSYEGGFAEMMKFLQKNLKYPSRASRMNIEGTVYVSFVVGIDGKLSYVEVIKGGNSDLDQEAMRVVSLMSKWNSGIQDKIPVAVKMVLPIKFSLGR